MAKTPQQEAGAMYYEAMDAVKKGGDSLWLLAFHIKMIVEGTKDFPGPLWKVRELSPDNKVVKLDKFEDYLFRPAREGLGIPGYLYLDNVMQASREGDKALAILRHEIPGYDKRVAEDRKRHGSEKARRNPQPERGVNQYSGCVNNTPVQRGSTNKDYLLARLARDHEDILSDYEQGRYKSVRQAAIAAGIVKVPRPFDVALKQVEKMDRQELIDLKIRIETRLKGEPWTT